jgi:hypothetical protein
MGRIVKKRVREVDGRQAYRTKSRQLMTHPYKLQANFGVILYLLLFRVKNLAVQGMAGCRHP